MCRDSSFRLAGLCLVMALSLAGCAKGGSDSDFTMTFGNLLAYNTTNPPPIKPIVAATEKVDCPTVEIVDGQAAYRSYANASKSNDSVRMQLSFGEIARECTAADGRISIRVGVAGYVLAGPAGGAGSISVPVRISIRSQSNSKIVESKVIRVAATIPAGETQATFSFVTDPLVVPYLREQADQDYDIFVGFDQNAGPEPKPARKRRNG